MTPPLVGGEVFLRPMRWWDLDEVLDVETELFGAEAWSAGLLWSELAQADTRHYLIAQLVEPARQVSPAAPAGLLAGYAGLAAYPDEGLIQTMAVRRDRWGSGIGTLLLTALLDEAQRRGLPQVELEVRADNDRAQRLYERFGFERIGVRRGYYQPSGTDAIVMIRRGRTATGPGHAVVAGRAR
jgi:ribosomal-protein-alanine N-acetyltransferase